jgi:iron complex transport system permease protein
VTKEKTISFVLLAPIGFALLLISVSIAVSVRAVAVPTSTIWGVLINKVVPGTEDPIWSKGQEAIV